MSEIFCSVLPYTSSACCRWWYIFFFLLMIITMKVKDFYDNSIGSQRLINFIFVLVVPGFITLFNCFSGNWCLSIQKKIQINMLLPHFLSKFKHAIIYMDICSKHKLFLHSLFILINREKERVSDSPPERIHNLVKMSMGCIIPLLLCVFLLPACYALPLCTDSSRHHSCWIIFWKNVSW
jgi:hypothetical protein